ncbi:MAG: choice-of-anchor Q domain-containing protein [Patescibacteria group bacterium]
MFLLLFHPSLASAANRYVRAGATGVNNGTDWANAWIDIDNISGITSGDVVYIAAGDYAGSYTSNSSGWTLKRATISEHGSDTGWNVSYDGIVNIKSANVVNASFVLTSSNTITIDGVDKTKFLIYGESGRRPLYGINSNSGSYDIVITNVTINDMEQGCVRFKSATGGMEVLNSTIFKCGYDGQEDVDGLLIYNGVSGANGNNIIANNYLHDPGYTNSSPEKIDSIVTAGSSYIKIYNNIIDFGWETENSADGISIRGGSNRYIYNNSFVGGSSNGNQNIFISGSGGDITNTYIYNNLFYRPVATAGSSVAININYFGDGGYPNSDISGLYIYNNTMYGQWYNIRFGTSNLAANISNIQIKNNIFKSGFAAAKIYLEDNIASSLNVDYNYYYASIGTDHAYMPSTSNRNLSGMRSSWGWETNGSEGDPLFNNISDENGFNLTVSSPNPPLNRGIDLSSVFITDKVGVSRPQGSAWDIGAYEYIASGPQPDTTPPSIPANLTAQAISSSQINLSWTASTDNVGVTGYRIYRNSSQIATSSANSYSNANLSPSTSYTYTVSAYDAAGNNSNQSTSAQATTQAAVFFSQYYEAESMNLISPMVISSDNNASKGQYIHVPTGIDSTNPQPEAILNFTISQSGTYYLWARIYGATNLSDALYIGIDSSWDRVYPPSLNSYQWIRIETSEGSSNNGFSLNSGIHTFQIGHGEINARTDTLFLTSDLNQVPSINLDITPPSPPTGLAVQ